MVDIVSIRSAVALAIRRQKAQSRKEIRLIELVLIQAVSINSQQKQTMRNWWKLLLSNVHANPFQVLQIFQRGMELRSEKKSACAQRSSLPIFQNIENPFFTFVSLFRLYYMQQDPFFWLIYGTLFRNFALCGTGKNTAYTGNEYILSIFIISAPRNAILNSEPDFFPFSVSIVP